YARKRGPLRLPDWPSPFLATFGVATSASPEPPPLTQITFPACCAHYPGGPEQVLVGCKLAHSRAGILPCPHGLPRFLGGSARRRAQAHPRHHFRGLLKLYTRYGLQGCSPTIRGLYREAPP